MSNLAVALRAELNAVEQLHAITRMELRKMEKDAERLVRALAECVDANDELHTALAGDPGSDPTATPSLRLAQQRETLAIEAARKLCVNWLGGLLE